MIDDIVKKLNLDIKDPWDLVDIFESRLAEYAGSKYAICLDSCSNALFLCLKYLKIENQIITIPANTYASVPMQIIHSGNKLKFENIEWSGEYYLSNTAIIDAATRFRKNMFVKDSYYCVSFHHRKTLKIGRGGAIFTDDYDFIKWCRPMIYDGRHKNVAYKNDQFECIGYHMYMTPEDAGRGLLLLNSILDHNPDTGSHETYSDLSLQPVFRDYLG